jgi:hypothetical protein
MGFWYFIKYLRASEILSENANMCIVVMCWARSPDHITTVSCEGVNLLTAAQLLLDLQSSSLLKNR